MKNKSLHFTVALPLNYTNVKSLLNMHIDDRNRKNCYFSAGEVVISAIQMYEANYPEILKMCYIINGTSTKVINI